jgi:hypothetical protein
MLPQSGFVYAGHSTDKISAQKSHLFFYSIGNGLISGIDRVSMRHSTVDKRIRAQYYYPLTERSTVIIIVSGRLNLFGLFSLQLCTCRSVLLQEFSLLPFNPDNHTTSLHSEYKSRTMGILDVARVHMVVLAFLSGGLLISISMFEKAWNDMQGSGSSQVASVPGGKDPDKTD